MTTPDQQARWWNLARWVLGLFVLTGSVITLFTLPTGELWERWGAGLIATLVCLGLCAAANNKYQSLRFADAHVALGTVTSVRVATGEAGNTVTFGVEATLPDGATIRRGFVAHGWPDPDAWVGRQIPFRHRTSEPDNLVDAYFGPEERRSALGNEEVS